MSKTKKTKKTKTNPKGAGPKRKDPADVKSVIVSARLRPLAHAHIIRVFGSFQAFVDDIERML